MDAETNMNKMEKWKFRVYLSKKTFPAMLLISLFMIVISMLIWVISLGFFQNMVLSESIERFRWALLVFSFVGVFGGMSIMFGSSLQIAVKIAKGLIKIANGDLTVRLFPVWCPVNSNVARAADFLTQEVSHQMSMLINLLDKQVKLSNQLLDLTDKLRGSLKDDRAIVEICNVLSEITKISADIEKTSRYFRLK